MKKIDNTNKNQIKNKDDKIKLHNFEKERQSKKIKWLSISCFSLGAVVAGMGTALAVQNVSLSTYETQIDNVYKKSLYDLVDSINNIETKLGKVVVSTSSDFQNKVLLEVANNADLSEISLASLPLSQDTMSDSFRFVNQVGGYTKSLAEKVAKDGKISQKDKQTLAKIKESMTKIKGGINTFVMDSKNQYSILDDNLAKVNKDNKTFSNRLFSEENQDVNFPIMIYDGPFSDSQLNFEVKGLNDNDVTKEQAAKELEKCFKNISSTKYIGEFDSRFQTYNFELETTSNHKLFAQVSKKGGNIITVSGTCDKVETDKISLQQAKDIAIDFAKENGIDNCVCVWSDFFDNQAYINLTPTQNNIILYPDLVKVKIDLSSGVVIGYDAATYFTNHVNRVIPQPVISKTSAKSALPKDYQFEDGRLVLAPLDYNREVLCYEFKGQKDGEVYYFYINALNGVEENILKVIKTKDGSKLM